MFQRRLHPGPSAIIAPTAWWISRLLLKDEQYSANPRDADQAEIEKNVIDTSIKFGILSRFTAFVAVDRDAKIEAKNRVNVVQPVESPAGWAANIPTPMSPAPSRINTFRGSAPPLPQALRKRSPLSKKRAAPAKASMGYMPMDLGIEEAMNAGIMTVEEGGTIETFTRTQILAAWLFEALSNQVYDFDKGLEQFEGLDLGLWVDLLKRALDKDPSVQFASMQDFLRALLDQKKVSYSFDESISLQTLFKGSNLDAKVAAITYLAGTPLDHLCEAEFSKEKIWFKGKNVSFAPVKKKKPFWKK